MEHWAIGQFNFSDLSQLEGIIEAAKNLKTPVILGTSEGESRFLGLKQAVDLKKSFQVETGLPIFLNLDHGKSFEYIQKAIELGYDMVHFDGSNLPLKKNIAETKNVVNYARKFGVLVEGEVGIIGNESSKIYEEKFEIRKEDLTQPKEAVEYVKETDVECLAVFIGNFHGTTIPGGTPMLDIARLKEIKKATKDKFLVLHGGSGTAASDLKKAIKSGIVKININTDLRIAYTHTLKKVLEESPKEITPYKYLPEAIKAVQKVVEEKIKIFGSKNRI